MVKRLFAVAASLLVLAGTAAAQNEKAAAEYAGIFRGKLPNVYPFKYNGTYYWEGKDFREGSVLYNGKLYEHIQLNVDA